MPQVFALTIALVNGHNVTKDGQLTQLTPSHEPALGYSLIEADTLQDALALLHGCPMDMWVYEAMPM